MVKHKMNKKLKRSFKDKQVIIKFLKFIYKKLYLYYKLIII